MKSKPDRKRKLISNFLSNFGKMDLLWRLPPFVGSKSTNTFFHFLFPHFFLDRHANMKSFALLLLVAGVALADKPSSGSSYGAPAQPQVKYGGPIVYSGEKPPIIHFPPPPATVLRNKYIDAMQLNLNVSIHPHRVKVDMALEARERVDPLLP